MTNPTPKYPVTFIPEGHVYLDGAGRQVPSRSDILYSEGFGWDGPEGEHTLRGTFVHDCNAAIIDDDLDDDAVPERFRGYIRALREYYALTGREQIMAREIALFHPWGYGVMPDIVRVAKLAGEWMRVAVELKSGGMEHVDLQLAAQVAAWNANFPDKQLSEDYGMCLQVRADATWALHTIDLAGAVADWSAIVRIYQRRKREEKR